MKIVMNQSNQRWYCCGTHKVMSERTDNGQNDKGRKNQGNQGWYCCGTHKVMSERIDDGQNDDCRMNYQKDA